MNDKANRLCAYHIRLHTNGLCNGDGQDTANEISQAFRRLIFETRAMVEGGMTFGEIILKLSLQKDYSDFTFLPQDTSSPDVRRRITEDIYKSKLFDNEIRQTAIDFFEKLGTTDTNGQLAYISMSLAALDEQISRLSENFTSQVRLCRALGVLSGAFIAILLI